MPHPTPAAEAASELNPSTDGVQRTDTCRASDRTKPIDRIKLELVNAYGLLTENRASDPYNSNLSRKASAWNGAGRRG